MEWKDRINVTKASLPPYEEFAEAIRPLWESHLLTNMGIYHEKLEKELKGYLGVQELSLIVNGHMALELALQMMGFPEGGEVITTPFTFVSTTHAIVRSGLIPVFCDVKLKDGTIDETKIERLITKKTVAILPVHVYGNVCNVEEIEKIASCYKLKVIYDAAHAFGVKYKGNGIGIYGDASIFSFHATKVFHTIEGGAVTFREHKYYRRLYNLKNFGIRGEELVEEVGANAKMNEFCAAMGLCNLKHIDDAFIWRQKCYNLYRKYLNDVKGIKFFEENSLVNSNYAYLPVLIEDDYRESRDELYNRLGKYNIFARKYFYPLTLDQICYMDKYKDAEVNNARYLSSHIITLPLFEGLEREKIEKICKIVAE